MIRSENLGKSVYLVGIKGAGMAGLAQILKGLGFKVQGSDIADTFFSDNILKEKGIKVHAGFESSHISDDINWAISSSAYLGATNNNQLPANNQKNPEIEELQKRNIPIVSYSEALGYFFNKAFGIAVTGTHGKSTTAAMIAYILEQAGKDPFALIGAELLNWHSNARVSKNPKPYTLNPKPYFVIEADEYREQFLNYRPNLLVITNIDYDHSDYFKTPEDYANAFAKFKTQLKPKGVVIEGNNLKLKTGNLKLQLIGAHNQANGRIAYEACRQLEVPHSTIVDALKTFKGIRRRLERIGEYNNAVIIDDYAHHPQEVIASLSALKEAYPRQKIVVLFHPHTYSRTQLFLKEFAKALSIADEIYLLDIYGSAREVRGSVNPVRSRASQNARSEGTSNGVSSDDLVEELQNLGRDALNLHTLEQATLYFAQHLHDNDVFITMGAGDVFRVAQQLTT